MRVGSVTKMVRALGALLVSAVALMLVAGPSHADTKTVMFGWEDGNSTSVIDIDGDMVNDLPPVFNTPDVGMGTLVNVSSGTHRDYGPSGNPFLEPVDSTVTPFEGNRMLEINLSQLTVDAGTDAFVYLGLLTGLDPGDTYSYTFYSHDPTDDRSPSATQNATYASVPNVTAFDGFAVRLQRFILGTGWLESELDGAAPTSGSVLPGSAIQPDVIFDPTGELTTTQGAGSTSNMANAVRLEANLSYQSLTASNGGSENFYIDNLVISVTSDNPNARIFLPDGTSVLVNEPAGLPGDYNENGTVDAADYTVWRDNLGGSELANEGASPGMVDNADFDFWKTNFGNTTPGSGSALGAAAVPEPASVLLAAVVVIGLGASSRQRDRRK